MQPGAKATDCIVASKLLKLYCQQYWRYKIQIVRIRNCWTEMLARSKGYIKKYWSIFDPNVKYTFIQHCFCDLGSHFEALESVLLPDRKVDIKDNQLGIKLIPMISTWDQVDPIFPVRWLSCPKMPTLGHKKLNFKMTARPLPVISLNYTGVPMTQPERKKNVKKFFLSVE
jgi:hypothetical protein